MGFNSGFKGLIGYQSAEIYVHTLHYITLHYITLHHLKSPRHVMNYCNRHYVTDSVPHRLGIQILH